jgi:hypothetical protein
MEPKTILKIGDCMAETLEVLMRDYRSNYSQEVRDLAETLCGSTTRLSTAGEQRPRAPTAELHRQAHLHGIDVEVLSRAVAHYSEIEALAEARARHG